VRVEAWFAIAAAFSSVAATVRRSNQLQPSYPVQMPALLAGYKKTPRTRRGERSILFCEHDREDAGRLQRVGRIFRTELYIGVVRVDLPKNFRPASMKLPKSCS